MPRPRFPGYAACLRLMRKRNPQLSEEGFFTLQPHAAEFIDELMDDFRREADHGLKCWLLELIGEARSGKALELLVEQLHSPDELLRYWAVFGLRSLDTHEARKALFEARCRNQGRGDSPAAPVTPPPP